MVDLDSDPTKILEVGGDRQAAAHHPRLLTTFSIANDIAKVLRHHPRHVHGGGSPAGVLNIMRLASPTSAILSL